MWPVEASSHTASALLAAVGTAAVMLDFIVAVKSPFVGAFVKFVTVVIVPAVMFVGVARPFCIAAMAVALKLTLLSLFGTFASSVVNVPISVST